MTNALACFGLGAPMKFSEAPRICELNLLRTLFWHLGTNVLFHWPGGGGIGPPPPHPPPPFQLCCHQPPFHGAPLLLPPSQKMSPVYPSMPGRLSSMRMMATPWLPLGLFSRYCLPRPSTPAK